MRTHGHRATRDPGVGEWEADPSSEPGDDGRSNAWTTACDEFFNTTVGGELFWGDTVVVSQDDCDSALAGAGASAPAPPPRATKKALSYEKFTSPSKNIRCLMQTDLVSCVTLEPLRGAELPAGEGARAVIQQVPFLEEGPAVPYGQQVKRGAFKCTSQETGMRCTDTTTGLGFVISKERVELF